MRRAVAFGIVLSSVASSASAAPLDDLLALAGKGQTEAIAKLITRVDTVPQDPSSWSPAKVAKAIANCSIKEVDRRLAPAARVMWTCKSSRVDGKMVPAEGYGAIVIPDGNRVRMFAFAAAHYDGFRGSVPITPRPRVKR